MKQTYQTPMAVVVLLPEALMDDPMKGYGSVFKENNSDKSDIGDIKTGTDNGSHQSGGINANGFQYWGDEEDEGFGNDLWG